jgi:hypothetical protein
MQLIDIVRSFRIRLALLLVFFGLVLVACGGANPAPLPSAVPVTEATTVADPTADPAAQATTVARAEEYENIGQPAGDTYLAEFLRRFDGYTQSAQPLGRFIPERLEISVPENSYNYDTEVLIETFGLDGADGFMIAVTPLVDDSGKMNQDIGFHIASGSLPANWTSPGNPGENFHVHGESIRAGETYSGTIYMALYDEQQLVYWVAELPVTVHVTAAEATPTP